MRSFMMPSIHAVASVSSMEPLPLLVLPATQEDIGETLVFRLVLSGGNKGRPEKTQKEGGWGCD